MIVCSEINFLADRIITDIIAGKKNPGQLLDPCTAIALLLLFTHGILTDSCYWNLTTLQLFFIFLIHLFTIKTFKSFTNKMQHKYHNMVCILKQRGTTQVERQVCDLISYKILEYFSFFLLMFFLGRKAIILLQRSKNFKQFPEVSDILGCHYRQALLGNCFE